MTNIEPHVIRAAEQHMAALGVARATTALAVIDTLNAENRDLSEKLRTLQRAYVTVRNASEACGAGMDTLTMENARLRNELTVATVAALAANDFYLCEYAGLKTYRLPSEIRESFATAIETYREATGMTGVGEDPCTHDHEMGALTDPDVLVCVTCGQNRG